MERSRGAFQATCSVVARRAHAADCPTLPRTDHHRFRRGADSFPQPSRTQVDLEVSTVPQTGHCTRHFQYSLDRVPAKIDSQPPTGLELVREVADQIRPPGIELISRMSQVASRSAVLRKRREPFEEHRVSIRELGEYLHKDIARIPSGVRLLVNNETNLGRLRLPHHGGRRARTGLRFCRCMGRVLWRGRSSRLGAPEINVLAKKQSDGIRVWLVAAEAFNAFCKKFEK